MDPSASCCSVIELRQYTTRPGGRDLLIELFDREFVETQEAHGMHVVGQFRDHDRPDRFVWMRGFPDMRTRGVSLPAFYGGPVWAHHRDAANATMIDSDNVLLLRPAFPESGLSHQDLVRPAPGAETPPQSLVEVTICPLKVPADNEILRQLELTVLRAMDGAGEQSVACYVTEPAENNFPALPVRAGENVLVWVNASGTASGPVDPARLASSVPICCPAWRPHSRATWTGRRTRFASLQRPARSCADPAGGLTAPSIRSGDPRMRDV